LTGSREVARIAIFMPTEDTTSMGNATERNVDKSPKAMMASSVVTYLNLAFGNVLGLSRKSAVGSEV